MGTQISLNDETPTFPDLELPSLKRQDAIIEPVIEEKKQKKKRAKKDSSSTHTVAKKLVKTAAKKMVARAEIKKKKTAVARCSKCHIVLHGKYKKDYDTNRELEQMKRKKTLMEKKLTTRMDIPDAGGAQEQKEITTEVIPA
jgi:hypothetical protein